MRVAVPIERLERYWLEFDKDTMTLRVIVPQHVWQAIREQADSIGISFDEGEAEPYIWVYASRPKKNDPDEIVPARCNITPRVDSDGNTFVEYIPDPHTAHDTTVALQGIFRVLSLVEITSNPPIGREQLVNIDNIGTANGFGKRGFYALASQTFRRWIVRQDSELATEVHDVVVSAFNKLNTDESTTPEYVRRKINVTFDDGRFYITTIGNGAWVSYCNTTHSSMHLEDDRDIPISTHNIDNIAQQFSLLVALFYLSGLVHRELYE